MISAELSAHFPFMVRDSGLPVWVLVKVAVALLPITGEKVVSWGSISHVVPSRRQI